MIPIVRDRDVITGNADLEHIHSFEKFPVFMGCVDASTDSKDDVTSDLKFSISKSSGMIQLTSLVPLDLVYLSEHGAGKVGKSWNMHHTAFAKFINQYAPSNVFEIGGGHGELSLHYSKIEKNNWTIIEPNPSPTEGVTANYIKGFFELGCVDASNIDAVVHSHVFEHMYDPAKFVQDLREFIKPGNRMIFSVPNIKVMLDKMFTNCMNFEHTILLTETYIEYLLSKFGFALLSKEYFQEDHSIFYAVVRTDDVCEFDLSPTLYDTNLKLFTQYLEYHKKLVNDINNLIENEQNVFLFGAHACSQYLLAFGLNPNKIISVLDNDPNKTGKRLYGSNLEVQHPSILSTLKLAPTIILRSGVFSPEIKKDILENICKTARFIE